MGRPGPRRWPLVLLLVWAAAPARAGGLTPQPAGSEAPELRLEDPRGTAVSLAEHRGKVVLVNFWASWCGPCVTEIPSLRALHERLGGQPFEVLAVNVEEGPFKVHKFSQLVAMPFPVLLDGDGSAFDAWGGVVLPTSFLVDPQGRVRYRVQGPLDWASEDAADAVRGLLPGAEAR